MKTRFVKIASVAFGLLWAASSVTFAQSQGNIYGKIYADWYDDQSNLSTLDVSTAKNQFELTRAYFGYKYKIDDNFTADVLLDVARTNPVTKVTATGTVNDTGSKQSAAAPVTVTTTTTTDTRYVAFLKTAFLAWKNVLPYTTLTMGQIPYFAFDVQEAFWGHRYIYKTFMDQQGWESSADLGAKAAFAPSDMLKVTLGVTDGEGYSAPQNVQGGYKAALAVQVNPVKEFTVYAYGDWNSLGGPGPTSALAQEVLSIFAGYNFQDMAKLGVEFDGQRNHAGITNHNETGISVNASYKVIKPLEIFGRFDMATSANGWNDATSSNLASNNDGRTAMGGLQYSPVKNVKLAADYQWSLNRQKGTTDPTANDRFYINGEFDY